MDREVQRKAVIEMVETQKIVTIARKISKEKLLPAAEALLQGGIRLLEVTFDQSSATCVEDTCAAIQQLTEAFGKDMCIGAGTVIAKEQVEAAHQAGARFVVSPNTNVEVISAAKNLGMVTFPGALTPTEIMAAYEAGADFVKIFPATALGLGYIKDVMAPISHVPLIAVGGVNEENIAAFLGIGLKGVGVGSNILKKEHLAEGDYAKIRELAHRYVVAAGLA